MYERVGARVAHERTRDVRGRTPKFYRHTYQHDRSFVTAAISNFPLLLQGGAVVDSSAEHHGTEDEGYQRVDRRRRPVRLPRARLERDGDRVRLVLQALGVRDALNVDGGGTSAMYIDGAYTVGPAVSPRTRSSSAGGSPRRARLRPLGRARPHALAQYS